MIRRHLGKLAVSHIEASAAVSTCHPTKHAKSGAAVPLSHTSSSSHGFAFTHSAHAAGSAWDCEFSLMSRAESDDRHCGCALRDCGDCHSLFIGLSNGALSGPSKDPRIKVREMLGMVRHDHRQA